MFLICFNKQIHKNLVNRNSDVGRIQLSCRPQVPHFCFTIFGWKGSIYSMILFTGRNGVTSNKSEF